MDEDDDRRLRVGLSDVVAEAVNPAGLGVTLIVDGEATSSVRRSSVTPACAGDVNWATRRPMKET